MSGRWRLDRNEVRKGIYRRTPGARAAIDAVGRDAAENARSIAAAGVQSASKDRGSLLNLPSGIRFKDIQPFTAAGKGSVVKSGDLIEVGLVVSDSARSQDVEFGANGAPAVGFMRAGAQKAAARPGVTFYPGRNRR